MHKRIVYLENDEAFQASLGEALKELNYEVELTRNLSMAEKLLSSFDADLLILSIDGSTDTEGLANELKKNKAFSKIPLVVLGVSGNEDGPSSALRDMKKDRAVCIQKPFAIEAVIDAVESKIGLPPPPKGVFPVSLVAQRELNTLKKENEQLKAEISARSKDESSTKASIAEKTAYIKELQKQISDLKKDSESAADELKLLKEEMVKKNKNLDEKEKRLQEIKNKKSSEAKSLEREIETLKKEMSEDREKHKKAQNALRDFYKPKLANLGELEEKVRGFEGDIRKREEQIEKLKKELEKERVFRDKMKKVLEE